MSMKLDKLRKRSEIFVSQDAINAKIDDRIKPGEMRDGTDLVIRMLKVFNNAQMLEAMDAIYREIEITVGSNSKAYHEKVKVNGQEMTVIQSLRDDLIGKFNMVNDGISKLVDIETSTPYGIFKYLLEANFSDILIHKDGIKISDNIENRNTIIPEDLKPVYDRVVDHFVKIITSTSESKLDRGNAILDAEMNTPGIGIVRYNIIDRSLNGRRNRPIVVLRKQTTNSLALGDEYLDSLGLTETQKGYIKEISEYGMTLIFGQVGSGKTTLMKYMGGYKLSEKRNLITIEDTPELGLDVPIALSTSENYSIKDLFVASLRQNPSGLVIGESRNDEIVDILEAALATDLAMSTIHATSLPRAIQRIVSMSMPRHIPREDIENLIKVSVTSFVYIDKRKVKGIWKNTGDLHKSVYDIFEPVE